MPLRPPLTDRAYVEQLAKKHGITPQRESGQNFLVCPEVVEAATLALAQLPERVTELGAGMGPLTEGLLAAGKTVRAIERDQHLLRILNKQQADTLTIVAEDLQHTSWTWDQPYCIAGNIPYNLSGLIIRRITTCDPAPAAVVLLVQAEVAARLTAQPGEMSLLSLAVQLWGGAEQLLAVPRTCFWPEPQVNSAVVLLTPRPDAMTGAAREQLLAFATPLFQQKRKQLGGMLKRHFELTDTELRDALEAARVTAQQRPQELSLDQWGALLKTLGTQA